MAIATPKPEVRPANPAFSSGPCAKRPGWTLAALDGALLGRSHRAKDPKARLNEVIERSKAVLGMPADWKLGIVLEKNGQPVALGAGAAVLGHPAAAIAMLANHLGRRGQEIPAGSLILSGGVTEAVAVAAGDNVNLRVQGMGSVSLRFA